MFISQIYPWIFCYSHCLVNFLRNELEFLKIPLRHSVSVIGMYEQYCDFKICHIKTLKYYLVLH